MKGITLILVVGFIGGLLAGCSLLSKNQYPSPPAASEEPSGKDPEQTARKDSPNGRVLIGSNKMPDQEVLSWAGSYRSTAGVYHKDFGDYRVYLIAAGEKPTGGYSVEIDQVGLTPAPGGGSKWIIDVIFKEPPPGAFVTQALTYPYELVAVPVDGNQVEVREVKGTQVRTLPIVATEFVETSKYILVEAPAPGSVIRSPVLIKGKAQVYEATLIVVIEDGHVELAREVVTATAAGPEWGEFSVSLPFARPTNPNGMIIIFTESAKDGSVDQRVMIPVRFE